MSLLKPLKPELPKRKKAAVKGKAKPVADRHRRHRANALWIVVDDVIRFINETTDEESVRTPSRHRPRSHRPARAHPRTARSPGGGHRRQGHFPRQGQPQGRGRADQVSRRARQHLGGPGHEAGMVAGADRRRHELRGFRGVRWSKIRNVSASKKSTFPNQFGLLVVAWRS